MNQLLKVENLQVKLKNQGIENQVLNGVHFQLEEGKLASLLGPSGCGKSTLLRALVGLETIDNGSMLFFNESLEKIKPHKRNIGLVFQDYALFPHLTAIENIFLGIKEKNQNRELLSKLINMVKIENLLNRYPHELSGGQQQRVALVRTLVRSPRLVLLDEPFSGLDSNLKEEMAKEMRLLFKELKTTAILVTHDQKEAFSFSDYIGVMQNGKIVQWSKAFDLYHEPESRFVATFIGETSFIKAKKISANRFQSALGEFEVQKHISEEIVDLMVRPDDIHLNGLSHPLAPNEVSAEGIILDCEFRGATSLYLIQLATGETIKALVPSHQNFDIHQKIYFHVDMDRYIVFP